MGQGGYLWIINATSKNLIASDVSYYQMNNWSFISDIPSQSKERFYIEFDANFFKSTSGKVTFTLEGTSDSFQLLVRWPFNYGECGLKINSSSITSAYEMFPPTLSGKTYGKLGWIHGGSLSLLITEKGCKASVPTDFPGKDSICPCFPTVPAPDCGNWMEIL